MGFPNLGLDVAAELSVKLDALGGRMDRLARSLEHNQIMRGHPVSWVATLNNIAAAPQKLTDLTDMTSMTGPTSPMVWEIRRITFGTPLGGVGAGGTLVLYREGVEVARNTTVPNFITFSGYELLVQPNEDLQAAWYGATTPGTLIVDFMALEYPLLTRSEIVE